ncbi:hypothetical protein BDY21DRAFT_312603 [Lineolata rhizophorae]|uniref:DUF4419 domain-containing protein n=1 Tax=Lineolata rhizophorae TaxID=578093 RepID=A0A6A6PD33_9PEZI|nr:hypothetical protein BDY21DRAFT_312603 [Lineolata rhizophorae]
MATTRTGLLGLAYYTAAVSAGITIIPSNVSPGAFDGSGAISSVDELFSGSCPEEVSSQAPTTPQVMMSTYANFGLQADAADIANVHPSSDSFVRGALEAWAKHEHLVIRPDEVWFEILAQMNFYMAAHAEEIRDVFVSHEGRESIEVWDFTWHQVIARFGEEIQERVKTDWLLDWVMPGFSTTTESDDMTATVLMMGLMQHYFEFSGGIICGLPSVTLLGERDDWAALLDKLEHMVDFGAEPADYAARLRPILSRFVATFDEPDADETHAFWGKIVRAQDRFTCGAGGAAPEYDVSGWIVGFLNWYEDGSLAVPRAQLAADPDDPTVVTLDDVTYTRRELEDLPVGYAKAPFTMLDYPSQGDKTQAYVLAGNIGKSVAPGAPDGSLQPLSAWFLYGPVDFNYTNGPPYGSSSDFSTIASGMQSCGAGLESLSL